MQYITILSEIYYDIMNKSLESYFAEKASSQELEIEKDIHNTEFDSQQVRNTGDGSLC